MKRLFLPLLALLAGCGSSTSSVAVNPVSAQVAQPSPTTVAAEVAIHSASNGTLTASGSSVQLTMPVQSRIALVGANFSTLDPIEFAARASGAAVLEYQDPSGRFALPLNITSAASDGSVVTYQANLATTLPGGYARLAQSPTPPGAFTSGTLFVSRVTTARGTVAGNVTLASNGQPVANAFITASSTDVPANGDNRAFSNADGSYSMQLAPGHYQMTCLPQDPSQPVRLARVTISQDQTTVQNFSL